MVYLRMYKHTRLMACICYNRLEREMWSHANSVQPSSLGFQRDSLFVDETLSTSAARSAESSQLLANSQLCTIHHGPIQLLEVLWLCGQCCQWRCVRRPGFWLLSCTLAIVPFFSCHRQAFQCSAHNFPTSAGRLWSRCQFSADRLQPLQKVIGGSWVSHSGG